MSATDSWRITVTEQDRSVTALPSIGNIGATVIRATKGPIKPVLIGRGQDSLIVDIFGKPTTTYPDVWEAIEANKAADIWISAPYKDDAKYGGVLVTKTGSEGFTSGFTSKTSVNFAAISWTETIGVGNGNAGQSFSFTLDDKTHYNNQSLLIKKNGVTLGSYAITDAATEVITATGLTSGSYVRSSGVVSLTFTGALLTTDVITAVYTVNRASDCYFILFNANPEVDTKAVKISMDSVSKWFTVNHFRKESNGSYTPMLKSSYLVSTTFGQKDYQGKNIYIQEVFRNNNFIDYALNTALTPTTFIDDVSEVDMAGGSRGSAITLTELTAGWAYFQDKDKYAADIFFDVTADAGIPALFATMATTYQKYKAYLLPLPSGQDATTLMSTKSGYSISNRNVYFYANWATVRDPYNGSYLFTNLLGRVFTKHAAMVNAFNGPAPAWIDENGHGGQLGGNIIEMEQNFLESERKALNTARINPIVFDREYGVMIISQRTSLSVDSDDSFICHSRVKDYLLSNIISKALPQQICKLNDNVHRTQAKSIADLIINPLLAPPNNFLRQALVVCDATNNTDEVLAQRKFIIDVIIKVTPTSEEIQLNFVNTDQGTDVKEFVKASS